MNENTNWGLYSESEGPMTTKFDNLPPRSLSTMPQMAVRDNLDFLASIPSGSVQLIITSPPYNVGKSYEKKTAFSDYLNKQRQVISECFRVLSEKGSICWQVGNFVDKGSIIPLDIYLFPIFHELGMKLRNRVIWHFEHGLHCKNRLSGRYETINWFSKTDDYIFNLDPIRIPSKYPQKRHFKGPKKGQLSGNPLGKNPGDVWIFPNVKSNHVEKTIHPCQFPIELVERLVLSLSNAGDVVFDPYLGVGSTVIGSHLHGRYGMGCDINPDYISIAWQRFDELKQGNLRIRPMGRPVYDPTKPKGGHG